MAPHRGFAVMTDAVPPTPRVRTQLPGPESRRLREAESKHIAPGFQAIAAHAGIAVARGEGSELIDVDGNRFLDLSASICVAALGYGHPRYVDALHEQLDRVHAGSFTTEARVKALETVSAVAPPGLSRLQLYSGGSETVESAIRLARAFTGKFETLSFWGGFHGKTAGSLAQMGSNFKHGLGPGAPGAHLTPYADCARCPFRATHPECDLQCVEFARMKIERETAGSLAAILVEPMQGTAGNIVPPPDFLPAVAALAKDMGALLIADEMITGFGRSGTMFGIDHTGVAPDIMTLGKALGGGFPVSAVLAREDVTYAQPWAKPSFSSSSYGGHPLAAAAVAASVGIIREDDLAGNARRVGARLRDGFAVLSERHPCMAHVRGEGLFIGFDLVEPTGALWSEPRCQALFQALLRRGLITMAYAPRVRINPPLIFSAEQADESLNAFDLAVSEVER
jgi:4-aminobutyrate aminotransferase / (S)-3-amino-2-methylpropionate transaminase / 5-aminovalerate transaminase